jgi:hypothetical protein
VKHHLNSRVDLTNGAKNNTNQKMSVEVDNGTHNPCAAITNKTTGTNKPVAAVAAKKPAFGKKPAAVAANKADVPAKGKKKAAAIAAKKKAKVAVAAKKAAVTVAAKKAAAVKNVKSRKTSVTNTGVVVTEVFDLVGGTPPPRKNKQNQVAFLPPMADPVLKYAAAAAFTTNDVAGAAIGLCCSSYGLIVGGIGAYLVY